tara:strand:- start:64 stop:1347 length:1284 start_codon:yes stop_codon:yes gene_type:complete
MIGSKKEFQPNFNFDKKSNFISDFLPGIKNEDWKYTNLKKFIPENTVMQPLTNYVAQVELEKILNSNEFKIPKKNVIFFLDGVLQKTISNIPLGICIKKCNNKTNNKRTLYMDEGANEFSSDEENSYTGFSSFLKKNRVVELNTLLTNSPYIIHFDHKFDSKNNIKIIHGFTNKGRWFNQERCLYLIESDCEIHIQQEVVNFGKHDSVFNVVSEIICKEGVSLNMYMGQNDPTNSSIINTVFCTQQKSSKSNFNIFSVNGKLIRNNILVNLMNEKCSSNVYGTSLLENRQHLDNFIVISHLVENCKSNQFFKSVYGGNSTGSFCGKIYVEKNAQQTEAFQQNNNLMISKNASVNAKPQLEIFADDVVCSHGCTIGAIDEKSLFYLRSRGISEKEAIKLLINAFLTDSISEIKIEEVRNEIKKLFFKE